MVRRYDVLREAAEMVRKLSVGRSQEQWQPLYEAAVMLERQAVVSENRARIIKGYVRDVHEELASRGLVARRQARVSGRVPDGKGGSTVVYSAIHVTAVGELTGEHRIELRSQAIARFREKYPLAGKSVSVKFIDYAEERTS